MDERIKKLEEQVEQIKDRNFRVEVNKSWEISKTRAASILLLTYICVSLVMYFIGVQKYFINAIIPTLGFFLSTLSLPFIKNIWVKINGLLQ